MRNGEDRFDVWFRRSFSNNEGGSIFANMLYGASTSHPIAPAIPTPGLAGAVCTAATLNGGLGFKNPAAGNTKYLSRVEYDCGTVDQLVIFDRLWHNSGIVIGTTTAQTVNSVTLPARDRKGTTNGEGCWLFLEVYGVDTTNAAAITTITASYTNSAGVAGRTAMIYNWPATTRVGTMVMFDLQAGDVGVQSVQSITLGTAITGTTPTLHLSICRPILWCAHNNSGSSALTREDALSMALPKLFDDTCLFYAVLPAGSSTGVRGRVRYTEG